MPKADTKNLTDYRGTLNVPLSDRDPGAFPQRASLPTREPEILLRWRELDIYRKSLQRAGDTFLLHDGPPYSNGHIHLGHAVNKVAKDIATRVHSMMGHRAPYVPGWDNHGMPIENAVSRRLREEGKTPDRVTLRKECRAYALHWVQTQSEEFQRLGIRGDWDRPYLTMSREFEARIVEVFGELAARGYVYRGLRPVLWCAVCETALADAEVEYEAHTSDSIWVRFPLSVEPNGNPRGLLPAGPDEPVYALIWTTTPWTIPANLALAVHPEAEYVAARATVGGGTAVYLVAAPLLDQTMRAVEAERVVVTRSYKGRDLEGLIFKHPLFNRTSPVVLAEYVTMDAGTGVVHTAPGHGKEDFETGQRYGLEVLNPVDASGRFTVEAGEVGGRRLQGLRVVFEGQGTRRPEANAAVIDALAEAGNLLGAEGVEHSYPHCWRCHTPLIFRATIQWFMNIDHDSLRQRALDAVSNVTWWPRESIHRITNMVAGRPDWCLSRQRSWGVGIPAFYCGACGEAVITDESIAAVADLVRREGSDAWYEREAAEILPPGFLCPNCGSPASQLAKETDVLDVWFDSGCTNRAVLQSAEWMDLTWPADVYLEGGDQHRGWFNSSLILAMATMGAPPFRSVVTNGWTLSETGGAMHKSKGNVVDPLQVVSQYGADVVRWWVTSQNFMEDTRCGPEILKQVSDSYRRVRNTLRFLLNNLYDFDPAVHAVPHSNMLELDRWALAQLSLLVESARASYLEYAYHKVYQAVQGFCSTELSAFYLDVLKDRLYASGKEWHERRSAQTALATLAETLARVLAPILVFTAEEVWSHGFADRVAGAPSVHLASFPEPVAGDEELLRRWAPLFPIRDQVNRALEESRKEGRIGNPLEARVTLRADAETYSVLEGFGEQLAGLLLVSQAEFELGGGPLEIQVSAAAGDRCARCWLVRTDVGENGEHPELCSRCVRAIGRD